MVTAMAMAQRRTLFIWNISIVYPGVAVLRNVIQPKEIQGKLMYCNASEISPFPKQHSIWAPVGPSWRSWAPVGNTAWVITTFA